MDEAQNNTATDKRETMSITWVALSTAAVVVALLWVGGLFTTNEHRTDTLTGTVVAVDGNRVTLRGNYLFDGTSEPQRQVVRVAAVVGPETELVKETVQLPTDEELAATDGAYNAADLERTTTTGSLDDLSVGTGVVVVAADGNIVGRLQFPARRLLYVEPVFPE